MATLVLSTVGGIVAGPIGAAIGAAAGNAIDRELLFKPKGREGPRLAELRVQTSSYGTQIPKIFGTMRVAGSVIWATDLVEHRSTQGGKGRPTTTSFSYSASFAVALSGRPILGVGRIWADGKLLRGAAGDFKTRTGFRLHPGTEEQAPDPLIASAEGMGLTPAHRGIAYAVFEDLELADFGNRIPSLSFEVFADPAPITAGEVIGALAGDVLRSAAAGPALSGFAAQGSSVRAVAEMLAGTAGAWFRSEAAGPRLMAGPGPAIAVIDERTSAGRRAREERSIAAAESVPVALSVSHYDPARDHQAGVQRATRPGAGMRELRVELAAAIDATGAKAIAEDALGRLDLERERRTVMLPWRAIAIAPGERVTIADAPGFWRVDRWALESMVVRLECVPVAPATLPTPASSGRVLAAADVLRGTTLLHAFELPPLGDVAAATPRIGVAAAGSAPGWRSAALLMSRDGGQSWSEAGSTAAQAVVGELKVPAGPAPATLFDWRHVIEVELAHGGMTLADADDAALAAGANLAMAGEELIQFAKAEPLEGNRWRLRGLWRGRRGTEARTGTQAAGDRFVLIRADTLVVLDLPGAALGSTIRLLGQGAGDDGAAAAEILVGGRSVLPLAPAQLAFAPTGGGGTVRWVRRSRAGWDWIDGVDAPLAEESERYRVTVMAGGVTRIAETASTQATLTPTECAAGAVIELRQIGAHGLSLPTSLTIAPVGGS